MRRNKPRQKQDDDTLLPKRGQASDDPGEDYLLSGIAFLLGLLWELAMCIVRPVWALLCSLGESMCNPRDRDSHKRG